MPDPVAKQGFLGVNLDDIEKLLPPAVTDAIKNTVGAILGDEPGTPNIGDPQPEGEKPIPVDAGSKELNTAVKVLDTVTGALDTVLKFGWVIPDDIEKVLKGLTGALKTIRSWLD